MSTDVQRYPEHNIGVIRDMYRNSDSVVIAIGPLLTTLSPSLSPSEYFRVPSLVRFCLSLEALSDNIMSPHGQSRWKLMHTYADDIAKVDSDRGRFLRRGTNGRSLESDDLKLKMAKTEYMAGNSVDPTYVPIGKDKVERTDRFRYGSVLHSTGDCEV